MIWLFVAAACLAWTSSAVAQPTPTEITIPLTTKGLFGDKTVNLAGIEYRPEGSGPFPAIVLSHGSPPDPNARVGVSPRFPVASEVFVQWGFVVVLPVRRGYGKTGGAWEEDSGRCEAPFYFAGGRGGKHKNLPNNNCAPDRLVSAAGVYGKTVKIPSIWLYTENDQYFAPDISRAMHAAFTASGGQAAYHLFPAIGNDGHNLISFKNGVRLWHDNVQAFFREVGVLSPP